MLWHKEVRANKHIWFHPIHKECEYYELTNKDEQRLVKLIKENQL